MKLYNEEENTFYLFNDKSYEDGVCCRAFDWEPGDKYSGLFDNKQAIRWLAEVGGSVEFIDLGKTLMIINGHHSSYGEWYDGYNFANTVGSLLDGEPCDAGCCSKKCAWLTPLAVNFGSVGFWYVDGIIMVEIWMKGKKGSFKFTDASKFIELMEKMYANL